MDWNQQVANIRDSVPFTKGRIIGLRSFRQRPEGPVSRSMVSVNQRLIPWQRIGFDTA